MKRLVHRPVRATVPVVPDQSQLVAPPPQSPASPTGGVPVQTLLPVLGAVSSMLLMTLSRGSNPVYLVVGSLVFVVALVSGLAMAFTTRARATRTRKLSRERYLDYLEDLRVSARDTARQVRQSAIVTDPDPSQLPQLITDPTRVWERRPADADFLRVRIGSGLVAWLGLTPPVESNPLQPLDPLLLTEATRLCTTASLVEQMPVVVGLGQAGQVAVIGPPAPVTGLAQAMAAQIAAWHSPEDVRMAFVIDPARAGDWPGVNRLPHCSDPTATSTPRPLIAPTVADLAVLLADDLAARIQQISTRRHASGSSPAVTNGPRLVVFLDELGRTAQSFPLPQPGYTHADLGVTVVHLLSDRLDEPSQLGIRVVVDQDGQISVDDLGSDRSPQPGSADRMPAALFDAITRDLAPLAWTRATAQMTSDTPETISALSLLGIEDVADISPEAVWRPRSARDFLRVPIGVDDHGAPLSLDLKEAAQLGMGPHGICIGATGSGKSELLRTLVLSLALAHPPDDLSMILVDYKGGAAFAPFARLPHVAGLIDNLADDPQLTRRARESISGEVLRRQELLKSAGSVASIGHYRRLRAENPTLPPLPHLFLVIDEFGELLTAEPEFSDVLLQIGRIGRSIGVHLLLASQRIEGGMLHGLDTYLSYWIGMRTFSEAESRAVLGTPDAFTLPSSPGYGYLKVDTSVYTRFKAGYVSGLIAPTTAAEPTDSADGPGDLLVVPFFGLPPLADTAVEAAPDLPEVGRMLVDEIVDRLAAPSPTVWAPAKPVWLPPLPSRLTLSGVLTDDSLSRCRTGMVVPLGMLDDPVHQRQSPWLVDLGARGGHLAIVGAPQSGRSTFLRTVAVSLALTHTPRQVSIYGVDLAGSGLARIAGFPQVGGVATRADPTRLNRLFEELHTIIVERETLFRTRQIDSVAGLRLAHQRGEVPELIAPDVVILIDGLEPLREEFAHLDPLFCELVQRGPTFGLHVVLALTRWNELKANIQPLIGQRCELRINEPGESTIQRRAAEALRASGPGRVLTQDQLYAQIGLPLLEDVDDDGEIGDGVAQLAEQAAAAWSGPAAAPIRLLPDVLDPADLPDVTHQPEAVPFGLQQNDFKAVCFDPALDQHLMVFGDARSGKTTVLRGLARGFMERLSPAELVFAVIDPRGGLSGEIPDDYLGGQAGTVPEAQVLSAAVAGELTQRVADRGGTYPRVVILVDDYDIISAGAAQPLAPLLPYLPSARDLGLSVIVTRPVVGASRGLLDAALGALRDTGGSGLVMNGEQSEGMIFPKVFAEQFPPGRGKFVRRGTGARVIQVADFTAKEHQAA